LAHPAASPHSLNHEGQPNHHGAARTVGGTGSEITPRSRLPVLAAALAVLWPVGWYCAGGDIALLAAVSVLSVAALLPARPLVRSSRAAIWGGILIGVILLAANMGRIFPPEDGYDPLRRYLADRAATLALAPALIALFTRLDRHAVTVVATGTLPALMLVLVRADTAPGGMIIWIGLALPLLADQLRRLSAPRPRGLPPPGGHERLLRLAGPLVLLAVGILLAGPISSGADRALEWAYGSLGYNRRGGRRSRDTSRLSLMAPPGGFAGQVRPLMTLRAPVVPGYLREAVFRDFVRGEWRGQAEAAVLEPIEADAEMMDFGRAYYNLADLPVPPGPAAPVWELTFLTAYRAGVVCLPSHAQAVEVDAAAGLVLDGDGIVTWDRVRSAEPVRIHAPPPAPDPAGRRGTPALTGVAAASEGLDRYLGVPADYRPAVSNWVAACQGLRGADSPRDAMAAVVRHFHTAFAYSLTGPADRRPDRLTAFMREQRGHCTLFATAATLMLRSQGIPARVVGGFLSHERHPLTGRWVVRERDGHAWCEAWDADAGVWRLVEATPPDGWPEALPAPGRLRLFGELLASLWRALADALQRVNPLVLLVEASIAVYGWLLSVLLRPAALVGLLLLAAILAGGLRRRRRRQRAALSREAMLRATLTRTMRRIERRSVPAAQRRRPPESWTDWEARVNPAWPPERRQRLAELVERYQRLRYHPAPDPEAINAWLMDARAFVAQR